MLILMLVLLLLNLVILLLLVLVKTGLKTLCKPVSSEQTPLIQLVCLRKQWYFREYYYTTTTTTRSVGLVGGVGQGRLNTILSRTGYWLTIRITLHGSRYDYLTIHCHTIHIAVFPTHSFICGGPPQYQHCPPHIDFLFVELRILFNHSDSAAVNNIMLNTLTQWMAI